MAVWRGHAPLRNEITRGFRGFQTHLQFDLCVGGYRSKRSRFSLGTFSPHGMTADMCENATGRPSLRTSFDNPLFRKELFWRDQRAIGDRRVVDKSALQIGGRRLAVVIVDINERPQEVTELMTIRRAHAPLGDEIIGFSGSFHCRPEDDF